MRERKSTKIDSLREREHLYRLIRKRIDALVEKEKKEGLTPELRESISTANALLREIRLESVGTEQSNQELKESVFGDWIEKQEKKRSVKRRERN
jgi:hypothetical protein